MTTHRSLRSILSLTATVLLIALAGSAFALEEAQFRPQVEQFLADEALPQFELEGSMRTQDAQNWPDEGVVRAKVGQEGRRREHYAILDEASGAVVGFIAAEPAPPVPMTGPSAWLADDAQRNVWPEAGSRLSDDISVRSYIPLITPRVASISSASL
jgi:hypothetical protein